MKFPRTRPKNRRPGRRIDHSTRPATVPQPLFNELLSTRSRYEELRISDGSFHDRAMLLNRLHELRFEVARGAII